MHCFAPRQVSINHKLQFPATLLQRYASPFDALVSSPVIYKEFADATSSYFLRFSEKI